MSDEDDENGFSGLYEDGHWHWDEFDGCLVFVSDLPPQVEEVITISKKAPTGTIEFRDDIDLIEQDVKDIALFTAPVNILSPLLINMLHLPTTERFIRALILCTQYYLQVADVMAVRMQELASKVRTPFCEIIERQFQDNLSDLRLLVGKEYCTMLIGGADTKKFHHMGPQKKLTSLSDKDARLIETLLRMCVQIVWLALGRKAFNQIELEVNRLFKSEIFNAVEHNLKTRYIANMTKEERNVLLGYCIRHDKKLNTRSPIMNEVFCHREIDYRIMGLGVIKVPKITTRLAYMMAAVAASEEKLQDAGVVLGIIGLPRSGFDTMLRPLPIISTEVKAKGSMYVTSAVSVPSKSSHQTRKSIQPSKLYPDIILPVTDAKNVIYFPPSFPSESEVIHACSETQRRRWQGRLQKLMYPAGKKSGSAPRH